MLESMVLLLDNNYVPITTCSARRAILMVWTGRAEIVETTGQYVRSVSARIDIPSIIRLLVLSKISKRWNIQLTRQNIMKRDHRICQYCGRTDGPMTIDHVVPRSHGGGETWENLVCACSSCNSHKGNRTLREAGMELLRKPAKPNLRSLIFNPRGHVNSDWRAYLSLG